MSKFDASHVAKGKLVAYLAVLDHNIQAFKETTADDDDVILEITPVLPSRLLPVQITVRDLRNIVL